MRSTRAHAVSKEIIIIKRTYKALIFYHVLPIRCLEKAHFVFAHNFDTRQPFLKIFLADMSNNRQIWLFKNCEIWIKIDKDIAKIKQWLFINIAVKKQNFDR